MDDLHNLSLENFLEKRGIANETIEYFKEENVDCAAIQIMEEDSLKKWIPLYGDRIAVKNFCKHKIVPKKYSLIEKLREKMAMRNNNLSKQKTKDSNESISKKTRMLKKETRVVEIGWLCFNKKDNKLTQVRASAGGGTRKISIEKTSACRDILKLAKNLFFPNGKSTKGSLEDFQINLLDFKQHPVDKNVSIQEMFEITGLTKLRFYLSTEYQVNRSYIEEESASFVTDTFFSDQLSTSRNDTTDWTSFNDFSNADNSNHISTNSTHLNGQNNELRQFINEYTTFDDHQVVSNQNMTLQNFPFANENILFKEKTKLVLHRGNVFKELVEAFEQSFIDINDIYIELVLPNGEIEKAEDMGGVFRDVLSEFWDTFYDTCTIGTDLKVPYLRHDFGENQWKSISKVLVKGWHDEKYFPLKLAPVFMANCFAEIFNNQELIESFLLFICESDAFLVKTALANFEKVDLDDLVDFVNTYDAKWKPTKENFEQLIIDIAHKELIQKPAFVVKCFQGNLKSMKDCNIKTIYEDFKPTAKNILSKIKINEEDLTVESSMVYGYLKKYIKEVDGKLRSAFLRFCTGSNIVNKNIQVKFINVVGFGRVPVAHTCSGLIELPSSYENYISFRSEFNNLLNSNVWIMDII